MAKQISIKLHNAENDDKRRFVIDETCTFDLFWGKLSGYYANSRRENTVVKYVDDYSDEITVSTDDDFAQAVECGKSLPVLKVILYPKQAQLASAALPAGDNSNNIGNFGNNINTANMGWSFPNVQQQHQQQHQQQQQQQGNSGNIGSISNSNSPFSSMNSLISHNNNNNNNNNNTGNSAAFGLLLPANYLTSSTTATSTTASLPSLSMPNNVSNNSTNSNNNSNLVSNSAIANRMYNCVVVDNNVETPPGTKVLAGQPFVRTWRVKNLWKRPWSTNTHLVFVGGKFGRQLVPSENLQKPVFSRDVNPDEEVNVSVEGIAPLKVGRYFGCWRLIAGNDRRFGPRLLIDIDAIADNTSTTSIDKNAADAALSSLTNQLESSNIGGVGTSNASANANALASATGGAVDGTVVDVVVDGYGFGSSEDEEEEDDEEDGEENDSMRLNKQLASKGRSRNPWIEELRILNGKGFKDDLKNRRLLFIYDGDVNGVLDELTAIQLSLLSDANGNTHNSNNNSTTDNNNNNNNGNNTSNQDLTSKYNAMGFLKMKGDKKNAIQKKIRAAKDRQDIKSLLEIFKEFGYTDKDYLTALLKDNDLRIRKCMKILAAQFEKQKGNIDNL